MKTITLPNWLQKILDDSGVEQGRYSFGDEVVLKGLPKGLTAVAEDGEGGGLAVAEPVDGVVYRFQDDEVDAYACDEKEFRLSIRRDEAWEALSENMPAIDPFWLGIVLKTKTDEGQWLTLGFKSTTRQSAMVIRGRAQQGDLLADALDRELREAMEITDYEVMDLYNEGGTADSAEAEGVEEPLFTVEVKVDWFDPNEKIQDKSIGWIGAEKKIVN